jgi:hypothetical protein
LDNNVLMKLCFPKFLNGFELDHLYLDCL